MAGKQNDSCQMGCDEEVENSIDYLFSSVKDNQVLHFEKLINGEINPKNKCGCTTISLRYKAWKTANLRIFSDPLQCQKSCKS